MKKQIKDMSKRIYKITRRMLVSRKQLEKKIDSFKSEYNRDWAFVFPSPGTPWGYMFQRPQQIATALAERGNLVFYDVEGNYRYIPDRKVNGILKIGDFLYLHNDFRNGQTFSRLNKIIIWRYWASQANFLSNIPKSSVVSIYDWVDDLNVHKYSEHQIKNHLKLLNCSDIVITTADKLYNEAKKVRDDVLLLPNGCDYEFFSNPRLIYWPELKKIRKSSEVIIGYYGAIADWFDFELLVKCATAYPSWTFLIVGQIYPNTLKNINLKQYKNIVILPRVEYEKLPYLLSQFDVTIIPFKINDITNATSPVKVFEYMAGGKPVVTTAMNEMNKLKNILVGKDHNEFITLLGNAYKLTRDTNYILAILEEAKENSWENRIDRVLEVLRKRGLLE